MLDLVRTEAEVVWPRSTHALEPHRPLSELGADSLMVVEASKSPRHGHGLRTHATVVFDHPTVAAPRPLGQDPSGSSVRGSSSRRPRRFFSLGRRAGRALSIERRFRAVCGRSEDLWRVLVEGQRRDFYGFTADRGWKVSAH